MGDLDDRCSAVLNFIHHMTVILSVLTCRYMFQEIKIDKIVKIFIYEKFCCKIIYCQQNNSMDAD